jgi:hypothetical protein
MMLTTVGVCDALPAPAIHCQTDPIAPTYLGTFTMGVAGVCDYRDPSAPLLDSFDLWVAQAEERARNLIGYYSRARVGVSVCPFYDSVLRPRARVALEGMALTCEVENG